MEINRDNLEKTGLIIAIILILFLLVFEFLNIVGLLPFSLFSSKTCCLYPTMGVAGVITLYFASKYRAKNTDAKTQELLQRSLRSSMASLIALIVAGIVGFVLAVLVLGIILLSGPYMLWVSIAGIILLIVVPLATRYLVYRLARNYFDARSQEAPQEIFSPGNSMPARQSPPGDRTSAASSDPIVGTWYSAGKVIKAVFHENNTFDIISSSQPGQEDTYIGGTYREEGADHYRMTPQFEGISKETARPIQVKDQLFVLSGSRLTDVNDSGVQFFKEKVTAPQSKPLDGAFADTPSASRVAVKSPGLAFYIVIPIVATLAFIAIAVVIMGAFMVGPMLLSPAPAHPVASPLSPMPTVQPHSPTLTYVGDFAYNKYFSFTGGRDEPLADQPIQFTVHRGNGTDIGQDVYLNGHSENWPYDVRFALPGDTPLSYWIESSDNETMKMWVKVPYIPGSHAYTSILLFYGKSGVVSDSDGHATFRFFDDFGNGPTVDPQWNNGYDKSLVTQSAGVVTITSNHGASAIAANDAGFGPGCAVVLRAKASTPDTEFVAGLESPDQNDRVQFYGNYLSTDTLGRVGSGGELSTSVAVDRQKTAWHIYKLTWVNGRADFYIDDSPSTVMYSNVPSTATPRPLLGPWNVGSLTVDWYAVMNYNDNSFEAENWGTEQRTGS